MHVRDELPLQDAVLHLDRRRPGRSSSVADGHGHKAHFRSDIGSSLAAVSAVEELRRVVGELTDPETAGDIVTTAAAAIVDNWVNKVRHHIEANPFDLGDERHAAAVQTSCGPTAPRCSRRRSPATCSSYSRSATATPSSSPTRARPSALCRTTPSSMACTPARSASRSRCEPCVRR